MQKFSLYMTRRFPFKLVIISFLLLIFAGKSFGQPGPVNLHENVSIRADFAQYFKQCGVEGSVVIYDDTKAMWIVSDTVDIKKETLPASTFKIINMLIALETGAIADERHVVKWPGKTDTVKYGYRPEIYHDMTVKDAFKVSAGWAFVEIAKTIDRRLYRKYLEASGYGNVNLSENDTDFWNFGPMGISPLNQVQFLRKFYEGKLPFSKRNLEIVKGVMMTEQNPHYAIYSKTGWTMADQRNTGWWVGYLKKQRGVYFFATRLLQDRRNNRDDFSACRKEITKSILRDLKIIQ